MKSKAVPLSAIKAHPTMSLSPEDYLESEEKDMSMYKASVDMYFFDVQDSDIPLTGIVAVVKENGNVMKAYQNFDESGYEYEDDDNRQIFFNQKHTFRFSHLFDAVNMFVTQPEFYEVPYSKLFCQEVLEHEETE